MAMTGFLRWATCLLLGLNAAYASAETPARARPVQPLATYFSDQDYPASALRAGEEGMVAFRLTVGPDGRAGGCAILGSSGSSSLDSATCRIMADRARFEPARDSNGKATSDEFVGRILWRLPDQPPQPRVEVAFRLWTGCIMGEATKFALTDLPPEEVARRSFPPCTALEALYSREIGQPAPLGQMRTQLTPMVGMMLVRVRDILKAPAEPGGRRDP